MIFLQDLWQSSSTQHIRVCETAREASSRSDLYALVVLSLAPNQNQGRLQNIPFEWRSHISAVPVPTIGVATGALYSVTLATDWRICSALAT